MDIRKVDEVGKALDAATAQRKTDEEQTETAETNLEAAASALTDAHQTVNTERETLERALDEWAREHRHSLKTDLREEAVAWVSEADAETAPQLRERVTERTRTAQRAIEQRSHELKTRLGALTGAIESKQVEWEQIRDERDDAPEPPPWRDRERDGRAGAPL